jgi:hypothetical protein
MSELIYCGLDYILTDFDLDNSSFGGFRINKCRVIELQIDVKMTVYKIGTFSYMCYNLVLKYYRAFKFSE